MDDDAIIDLYWARSEEAIRESDRKYGPYCRAIALRILRDDRDGDECVSDTWLRAWQSMPPERPLRLGAYLGRITRRLALEYRRLFPDAGLPDERIELIATGSVLHDLGKIMIPDNVLLKPGRLTDEEFALMKTHSRQGAGLLEQASGLWDEEYGKVCREICLYHHERADGRGYPCGLKEEDIPLSAQLTSLADVYDALTSDRCYRKAFDRETACRMITEGKCGCFPDKLMKCFQSLTGIQ